MIVIFYRNENGNICSMQKVTGAQTMEEIQLLAEKYNTDSRNNGKTAEVIEIEPGSIMEYLYRCATENIRFQIESLSDLYDTLSSAETVAYELLCQARNGG